MATADLGPKFRRLRAEARAAALPYSRDEREALVLLFLPFLLVASAVVVHQSVRTLQSLVTAIAIPDQEVSPVRPIVAEGVPFTASPQSPAREARPGRAALAAVRSAPEAAGIAGPPQTAPAAVPIGDAVSTVAASSIQRAPEPSFTMSAGSAVSPTANATATPIPAATKVALLARIGEIGRAVQPLAPDAIETLEADENGKPVRHGICAIDQAPRTAQSASLAQGGEPLATLGGEAFGLRLAKAAEAQIGAFVIYNDAYRSISYPMGDVNRLFGVCTDVVVRAYRALGLDLQALVHRARAGRGDTSIDHRRTEVLRRFFGKEGESIAITTFPEDYRPGDIVTYYRPQNRGVRSHIAIVSSLTAPSGRPMIVHNRGWGPQLEDALFVDQITGHYRYRGPAPARNADAGGGPTEWATAAPILPASFEARLPRPAPSGH